MFPHNPRLVTAVLGVAMVSFGGLALAQGLHSNGMPTVTAASPLLTVVGVHAIDSPARAYTVTLKNTSATSVRTIEIVSSHGGRPAMSTQRFGREGAALIAPSETYAFDIPVSAPIDRIAITVVTWTDDTYNGNQTTALMMIAADRGEVIQLRRVTAELERARAAGRAATPATLQAALDALPTDVTPEMMEDVRAHMPNASALRVNLLESAIRVSLQSVKKIFLNDVTAFDTGRPTPEAFDSWLISMVVRCQRWSALLSR